MSLVHEALQKAEKEKQRKAGVAPAPQPPSPVVPAIKPVTPALPVPAKPVSHAPVFTTVVVCVGLVAVVAIVWLVSRAATTYRQTEKALTVEPAAKPAPPTPTPTEPVAAPQPPSPGSPFKLTGISRDPDGTYIAVINGKIVSESQFVDGAIVKRIERDRVTLDVDGRELVVRYF